VLGASSSKGLSVPHFTTVRSFFRNLFRSRGIETDLNEEVRAHLAMLIDENLRQGMSPDQAQRAARIELGGIEQLKEQVREQRLGNWLHSVFSDCRFALRQLRKSPAFTAVAILTLALGIGANTAMFSLVNSVLFRPLPYRAPEQLVWASDFMPRQQTSILLESDFYAWRARSHTFTDMAAYEAGDTFTLTGSGEPERLSAARATFSFFDVLGIAPQFGRTFRDEEDRPGAAGVALISDKLWRGRFASNPSILGQSIQLDSRLYTILGVLPGTFEFLDNAPADVITPFVLENREIGDQKAMRIVRIVGRLRPGITPSLATADLDAINQHLFATYPPVFAHMFQGAKAEVIPLREHLLGKSRPALLTLLGAVGFVLLIACANIASLQLARAVSREKEIAIRSSLGAGKWRVLRQLLTENVLLAFAGGFCGLLFSAWLIRVLVRLSPTDVPHLGLARLDLPVLLFTVSATSFAGLLFGIAPAIATLRPNLVGTLKESGVQSGVSRLVLRSQRFLVVAELAAALILLTGSMLLLRSFHCLASIPPGFEANGVFTARIPLPPSLYSSHEQQVAFFEQLIQRASAIPGVTSAAVASVLPLQGSNGSTSLELEGRPPELPGHAPAAEDVLISSKYFQALRIPLLSGTVPDAQTGENPVVVNQAFVRRFFPDDDPIGRRVLLGKGEYWTIVGVVADTRQFGLAAPVEPSVFVSFAKKMFPEMTIPELTLLLRTNGNPESLLPTVRSIVSNLDKDIPIYDVLTLQDLLRDQTASQRFSSLLLSAFALLAILLTCLGVYGVTAYSVNQRTREFGLRMALGALPGNIAFLILRQAAILTFLGVGIGIATSLALGKLISSMLFQVQPTDPISFFTVSVLLPAIILVACYLPARRATRIDPVVALRYE
jgi:putative ABC transport system permease protein